MSISGLPALISPKKALSSGCQQADPSHSRIGMPENRIISSTRTARKRIAWNCGIAMAKD